MDSDGNSAGLNRFRKVCVIGCGASGLVAARELKRHGFQVVAYEQNDDVGGVWLYDSRVEEDDLLGLNPNRKVVHSSLYASLRTNLPRESAGFMDYPFDVKDGRDGRRFPGYQEMQLYLRDFARDFNLLELIKFSTEVVYVGMIPKHPCVADDENSLGGSNKSDYGCEIDSPHWEGLHQDIRWVVRSRKRGVNGATVMEEEVFDAVVVCNGHYSQPKVAQIPGMHIWPGKQIHSHNYRLPDPFYDQVVVIIGNSSSALDISLELTSVAKEVHISARSAGFADMTKILPNHPTLQLHSMVECLKENGTVLFQDGSLVFADCIIHCTGYSYSFPFLDTKGKVTVDDNRVGPLYEHIFPPSLAPSLSFVGIPKKVNSFPFFEIQSKWIAHVLSGKAQLPSKEEMTKAVEDLYSRQEVAGIPKYSTHCIEDLKYCDWLADQCGSAHIEEWRNEIILITIDNIKSNIELFRDSWGDQHLLEMVPLDKSNGTIA